MENFARHAFLENVCGGGAGLMLRVAACDQLAAMSLATKDTQSDGESTERSHQMESACNSEACWCSHSGQDCGPKRASSKLKRLGGPGANERAFRMLVWLWASCQNHFGCPWGSQASSSTYSEQFGHSKQKWSNTNVQIRSSSETKGVNMGNDTSCYEAILEATQSV